MATPTPEEQREPFAEAAAEAVQTAVMAMRLIMAIADAVRRHQQRQQGREEEPPPAREAMAEAAKGIKQLLPPDLSAALTAAADWPQFAQQLMALHRAGVDVAALLPQVGEIAVTVRDAVAANTERAASGEGTGRWEKALRETLPAGPVREAILSSPAWPDMAATMAQLDERGVDVRQILASAHEEGVGVDRAVAKVLAAGEAPTTSRDAMLSYGPLTTGLDVPKDLDLAYRQRAFRQLAISPSEHQRCTRMVREAMPGRERETDLLVASKSWPLLVSRMMQMEDRGKPVREHLARLEMDTSWEQGPGPQLGQRLVQATLDALRRPLGAPAAASRATVSTAAARAQSPSVGPTKGPAAKGAKGTAPAEPAVAAHREAGPAPKQGKTR
ncbi:hypothetical protein AB0B21_33065 [Streptomyces rimosus]|uniref:hypothetical protein n=1 Tax=Streptomyces rimosus TaxID=1927 RepID=UPI00067B456E|nr:hypothetical protein [Streptomyces rimosus]